MKKILVMLLAVAMLMVPVSILASAEACTCIDCEECVLEGEDCICAPAEEPTVEEPGDDDPIESIVAMFIRHIKEYINLLIAPILDFLNEHFGDIVVEG